MIMNIEIGLRDDSRDDGYELYCENWNFGDFE